MKLLSAHYRICKSDQFRALPAEGWVQRVILPRLFILFVPRYVMFAIDVAMCLSFSDGRFLQMIGVEMFVFD